VLYIDLSALPYFLSSAADFHSSGGHLPAGSDFSRVIADMRRIVNLSLSAADPALRKAKA
jgi:hypothetical protein